jgi:hypothetical protein
MHHERGESPRTGRSVSLAGGAERRRSLKAERNTMHPRSLVVLAALTVTGAVLLSGCGSSSKPAYCTQVNNFKESVKTLEGAELSPTNLTTIKTDIEKVGTSAKELKSAVKTEFAPQIKSLEGAVEALEATAKSVASSPSTSSIVNAISSAGTQIEAVKKAGTEVQEVTDKKC